MKSEISAILKYMNGGKVHYMGSEERIHEFVDMIYPDRIKVGDAPDFFVDDGQTVLIIEHFAFDCYRATSKGSAHRRELARIQRKEDSIEATEEGVIIHDVINGKPSYQDYIRNVVRSFNEHYNQIDNYITNLKRLGAITDNKQVRTAFLIEDTSPIGSIVLRREGNNVELEPVCLAFCKEFLDVLRNSPKLDFVLSCASKENVWLIDCHDLQEYYDHSIDYASMDFVTTPPQVIAGMMLVPNEKLKE